VRPTVGAVPPARACLDVVAGAARAPRRVAVVAALARGEACRPLRVAAA